MHKQRLEQLADGVFAIVMTLLVLDIKVPDAAPYASDAELWRELKLLTASFLSYILSFLVLASYWMGHHFIVSMYAKNISRMLAFLNVPFLMMVSLVPFSTHLLSKYPQSQLAIGIYGCNVILIGLLLYFILDYVIKSHEIENTELDARHVRYGYIRVLLPIFSALLAVAASFKNTRISIYIFIFTVLFNIIPGTLSSIDSFTGFLIGRKEKKPTTKRTHARAPKRQKALTSVTHQ